MVFKVSVIPLTSVTKHCSLFSWHKTSTQLLVDHLRMPSIQHSLSYLSCLNYPGPCAAIHLQTQTRHEELAVWTCTLPDQLQEEAADLESGLRES